MSEAISRIRGLFSGIALLFVIFTVALSAAGGAAAHDRDSRRAGAFLGLWEGIDPYDGSTVQLSVSDADEDGKLEIAQRESFFSACFDEDNNTKGRGKIVGTGTVRRHGVLKVETTFTCINDDNTDGPSQTGTFYYPLASGGRVLIIPGDDQFPAVVMHRTAE